MQHQEATGPRSGVPPQADGNLLQQAKDWLPGVPGNATAWATSLEMQLHSDLVLSEEQRLQVSKELVDLQIATHRLQEQHEAELFMLKSEVLRLESRVLELELQGRPGQGPVSKTPRLQVQPKDCRTSDLEPQNLVQSLPGDTEPTLGQQRVLETQVAALCRQLQGAREEAQTARQQLATQAVALCACQGQLCHAEAENSRLQLQLKRMNEEYTVRLQHCARDMADYADGASQAADATSLRTLVEATLEELRAAHRHREQQLARAAHAYRKRLADLSRRHEELLAAHSHLRPAAAAGAPGRRAQPPVGEPGGAGGRALEAPGPAGQGFLQRGESGGPRMPLLATEASQRKMSEPKGLDAASWAQIHQQLQDFSRGTQAKLERERAQLLVRATVAEEQLSELQEYVDQHLCRYKQEILRLRKLLDAGGACTVEAIPRPPKTHSR
ncbi:coiled-coil domain-containing protein 78 [Tamandua tetradactyla]|uniref:coiled-coil domain-containing protein 78 n=1 Tax=Tamandua tetradactyla TaxID=48850 RepID=UPI0040540145